jgi:hypothetical protein
MKTHGKARRMARARSSMARIKGTSLIEMLKVLQKNPAMAERVIPPSYSTTSKSACCLPPGTPKSTIRFCYSRAVACSSRS